jgi:cellulose synthase/poly-beta-1,6-N-acetylglucosamine synthase-like glycosyltransferase
VKDRFAIIRWLKGHLRPVVRRLLAGPAIFAERYVLEDNSRVTLYTDDDSLRPDYSPRESLRPHLSKRTTRVSLIASVKNEATNAAQWCESIFQQTRLPDEIIVVDAGSRDGTLEILGRIAANSPTPFSVLIEPGANIARARNLAIERARFPIIAVTDFGCRPRRDWLEKIIAPFEADPSTRVVAGLYEPVDQQRKPAWRGYPLYPVVSRIDPQNFLPSNRSIAFTQVAWKDAGGYPEWLTLTGEDTWFDRELQRHGGEWAFVPTAIVEWHAPENFVAYLRKVYRWAIGDGESGLHASFYWRYILQLTGIIGGTILLSVLALTILRWQIPPTGVWLSLIAGAWLSGLVLTQRITGTNPLMLIPEIAIEVTQIAGYLVGARQRNRLFKQRLAGVRGYFFILSGIPIDDTGGGARCTQIALELLRQNFAVVFIHKFPKYESRDLQLKIAHRHLFHYRLAEFDWQKFIAAEGQLIGEKPLAALVEFPLRDFLPLIEDIRACNGIVAYDLLDAWDTALGGKWYACEIEKQIAEASDVLVATVPALVERLRTLTGRDAILLPNAVNTQLFDPTRRYARPADFPSAEWVMIYTGALWGEWFDWELLKQIGRAFPQAAVVVIGDYQGQCADAPANIHFLGLKAQKDLPAYLAHSTVAIIPWKANKITDATSPLKVYEYLAMRLPVVAPDIAPLHDMPGVYLAYDTPEFLAHLIQARTIPFPLAEVDAFIRANNWPVRVNELLRAIQAISQDR